jgi:predicted pyridoxine 5'-phosphate oxidase superfamily flavin-nucleotide-binding protein
VKDLNIVLHLIFSEPNNNNNNNNNRDAMLHPACTINSFLSDKSIRHQYHHHYHHHHYHHSSFISLTTSSSKAVSRGFVGSIAPPDAWTVRVAVTQSTPPTQAFAAARIVLRSKIATSVWMDSGVPHAKLFALRTIVIVTAEWRATK